MSEVLRTYRRSTVMGGAHRGRRRRWRKFSRGLAVLLILTPIWFFWTTRDSQSMDRLIPARHSFEIFVGDFLNKRAQMAGSSVWSLAPEAWPVASIPEYLASDFGMPAWLINNLIYGPCHVSGNDVSTFSDVVFVTRMSRIGCLIERFHAYIADIEEDYAGGLELRRLRGAELYYGVRGRILVVSPSRSALIHALTLPEEGAMPPELLASSLDRLGDEVLRARIRLLPEATVGQAFEDIEVVLKLDGAGAQCAASGVLTPAWRLQLAGLLGKAVPATLKSPPPGPFSLSANFGAPFGQVWPELLKCVPPLGPAGLEMEAYTAQISKDVPALPVTLATVMNATGDGWRFAWSGVAANASVPVPEVEAHFDVNPVALQEAFGVSGSLVDAGNGAVSLPLALGPALEPTFALQGGTLLLSSNRARAAAWLGESPSQDLLPQRGNLFLRLNPGEAAAAVFTIGEQFADFGAIKGHTPQSFSDLRARWRANVQRIRELTALVAHEDGKLTVDFRLNMEQQLPDASGGPASAPAD